MQVAAAAAVPTTMICAGGYTRVWGGGHWLPHERVCVGCYGIACVSCDDSACVMWVFGCSMGREERRGLGRAPMLCILQQSSTKRVSWTYPRCVFHRLARRSFKCSTLASCSWIEAPPAAAFICVLRRAAQRPRLPQTCHCMRGWGLRPKTCGCRLEGVCEYSCVCVAALIVRAFRVAVLLARVWCGAEVCVASAADLA